MFSNLGRKNFKWYSLHVVHSLDTLSKFMVHETVIITLKRENDH